jgi:S1-C subfamily serine protease
MEAGTPGLHGWKRIISWTVISIVCFGSIGASYGWQKPETRRSLPPEAKDRMRRAMTTVGLILVGDGDGSEPRPRGSGVVVRQDGVIVTNWHVVTEDNTGRQFKELFFSLAPDSGAAPAVSLRHRLRVVDLDRKLDLALLIVAPEGAKAAAPAFPFIEIGNSRAIELLDDLVIIGFPEKGGATATLSRGIVEGKDDAEGWIKTDTRLLRGNSGGAAVNSEGKLIGIATKVEIDRAQNDAQLGTVGYLRPAYLVSRMLDRLHERERAAFGSVFKGAAVTVRGIVKSSADGKPIAGARVGLIQAGRELAPESLISWGGTNADGVFQLEKPVQPGKYSIRAKVIGDNRYAVYNKEVEIKPGMAELVIEIQPASKR